MVDKAYDSEKNQQCSKNRLIKDGPVEKWEGSDKNLRNWPKIKWPIYIINH